MNFIDFNYLNSFMKEHEYPEKAVDCFMNLCRKIDDNKYTANFNEICNDYMYPEAHDSKKTIESLKDFAVRIDAHEYSVMLLFWILCSKLLKKRYAEKGISEEIFFDTMHDLKYKLIECMNCEEICGTFTEDWYHGFFAMNRFALGRFEFEKSKLDIDYTMSNGTFFEKGTPCLAFHIPSSGISLTDEVRFDSYSKAYDFFKDYFKSELMILTCGSWLLYEKQREFLPEKSNILKFLNDFDVVTNNEQEGFASGWRLFGKDSDLQYNELPEDTSVRRAYKNWLIKTGKTGDGFGIIIFDGKHIINKND